MLRGRASAAYREGDTARREQERPREKRTVRFRNCVADAAAVQKAAFGGVLLAKGRRIEVRRDFDAETLIRLVRTIEEI